MNLKTAESVTEGHPDKMADRIADAVLDNCLAQDERSRVACEVLLTGSTAFVAGEITTRADLDLPSIVHSVWPGCTVVSKLQSQAPALSATVEQGTAGDQGIVVGYATTETPELMPMPILLAHRLTRGLTEVRTSGLLPYLRADGKAQVTVRYEGNVPVSLATVVVSSQHDTQVSLEALREGILTHVVATLPLLDGSTEVFINQQAGRFEIGGPQGDTGLTGRKVSVDNYGPQVPHGGGSFSGKDGTKIDRSGAYMLRHIAKNVVSSGMAKRCLIEAAYCIGIAEPVALRIETFGTETEELLGIAEYVRGFPMTPGAIIEYLGLRRPIFGRTACYGHFGRDEFPWESTNAKSPSHTLLRVRLGNFLKTRAAAFQ